MALTYEDALDAIQAFGDPYTTALTGDRPAEWGLEGIRKLLNDLGNPHEKYPVIHIAGTKGKGSTAAFAAQCLLESGVKTGLYTSPHLEDWRERIQIDRAWIAQDQVVAAVEDMLPIAQNYPQLTAFEITTALALYHFAREGCEAAVIEVGLGGALDATSIVTPVVSVITSISIDHTQILGNSLQAIAADKAQIIKPGVPAVSAPQLDEAMQAIRQRADEVNSSLTVVTEDWQVKMLSTGWDGSSIQFGASPPLLPYFVGMPGLFQVENAALALAALHIGMQAGLHLTEQGLADGLANAYWPGRMEIVDHAPFIVLDGAHNAYSVGRAVESLVALSDEEAPIFRFIFGCMGDKDIKGMLSHILPVAEQIVLTQADTPRASAPADLQEMIYEMDPTAKTTVATSVEEAVELAQAMDLEHQICMLGSLAVVGEARTILLGNMVQ